MHTVTITLTSPEDNVLEVRTAGDVEDADGNLTQAGGAAAFMVAALGQIVKSFDIAETAATGETADVVH